MHTYLSISGLVHHHVRVLVQLVAQPGPDLLQLLQAQVSDATSRFAVVEGLKPRSTDRYKQREGANNRKKGRTNT